MNITSEIFRSLKVNELSNKTNLYNTIPAWYAAYTHSNHERRVAQQLALRGVDHLLPLYESRQRWSDRHVSLQRPLFPGYVFVRMPLCERLCVLQVPGVARLVGFGGTPVPLPEEEMQLLRAGLEKGMRAEPHPFLRLGRRVRVKTGPMSGLRGILQRRKSRSRLVISLELIQRSITVEISELDVEPC